VAHFKAGKPAKVWNDKDPGYVIDGGGKGSR